MRAALSLLLAVVAMSAHAQISIPYSRDAGWMTNSGFSNRSRAYLVTNAETAKAWHFFGNSAQTVVRQADATGIVSAATSGKLDTAIYSAAWGALPTNLVDNLKGATNGLNARAAALEAAGYVTAAITNGLATTNHVNASTNGHVHASVTNGLATISFVTNFYRAGSVGLTKTETTKAITFATALADTNYALMLAASTNTVAWYSNKTVNGFTLRVTVGLTGRVDYIAIPQR